MSKAIETVLSFRVVNRNGETLSTHASRVDAADAAAIKVQSVRGEAFTIEGLPRALPASFSFRSIL